MDTITTIAALSKCNGSAQPVMVALMPNEIGLIAAAPDLLEALQAVELARHTDEPDDWQRATKLSNAAIARARGAA